MIRVLSSAAVSSALDLESLLAVVERGLIEQARGRVERPERPHYPIGRGLEVETGSGESDDRDALGESADSGDPLGTGLAMPAYVHGADYFATKLAGVFEGNAERDLPTVHAQIILADARTGRPVSLLDGTVVTGARTGCIGGLAVRTLVDDPVTLGVVGAGTQARWQTRAIGAACDLERVRIYSPSDSREACAADLRAEGFDARAVGTSREAVAGASVVVTATTSAEPVFPADALAEDAVVVAVGAYTREMQELEASVLERASQVFADVPEEVAEIGDLRAIDLTADDLLPLGSLLAGDVDRTDLEGPVIVESVGSAVLDAVAAEQLYETALEEGLGADVSF